MKGKKKCVRIPSTCIYHFFNTKTKSQKTKQTITSSQISFVKNISYLKPYATPQKSVILDLVGQYIHVAFCLKSLHQKYNFLPLKIRKQITTFPLTAKILRTQWFHYSIHWVVAWSQYKKRSFSNIQRSSTGNSVLFQNQDKKRSKSIYIQIHQYALNKIKYTSQKF